MDPALALIGDLGLSVIDDAEIAKCRAIFNSYDEDHDGKLTYAELLTCVRVCGSNPSVNEFKELVQVVDTKLVRAHASFTPTTAAPLYPSRHSAHSRVCMLHRRGL